MGKMMGMKPNDIRILYQAHQAYWTKRRPEMRRMRGLYMMRRVQAVNGPAVPIIQTSRGYEVVEGYVASLFTRDPSVTVTPDLHGRGSPASTQATSNDYLRRSRDQIEQGTRLSLTYDGAFLKLLPTPGPDPLQRVEMEAVPPWDVIVDVTARSWPGRYVGHRYMLPLAEAQQRYGSKKFAPRPYHFFLDEDPSSEDRISFTKNNLPVERFIEVVEFYDLSPGQDALLVWSPDYAEGNKFLYEGVKIQVGSSLDSTPSAEGQTDAEIEAQSEVYKGIPYRTASGRPVPPIIPLLYTTDIDIPLYGYSALRRSAWAIEEIDNARSYQSRQIRKVARQWFVRKGLLDGESATRLAAGADGEVIELELPQGVEPSTLIFPVPHAAVREEIQTYVMEIDSDLARGSVMAPFTRGEATGATATEVRQLASYTSSEVGKMARVRDQAIASIARVYSIILSLILGDSTEPLLLDGEITLLTASDLTGDFTFYATDAGNTPLAAEVKRRAIVDLAPLLMQVGVSPETIRAEIVRQYDLPRSFLDKQEAPIGDAEAPSIEVAEVP